MRTLYGVYRAVCLSVDANAKSVSCHVPQVFAIETVTCLDVTGGLPVAGDTGWVSFESGFPDRPVWLSAGSGSGSGGTDEVWVGPNDPGGSIELWYDTDATGAGATTGADGDALQRIAVPSYFWVTWYNAVGGNHDWERMQAAAPVVDITVMNPNSGPDTFFQSDWLTQVNRAKAAGLMVFGYIRTNYTIISAASVKTQIDRYYDWYHVDGIFLDETSWEAGVKQQYYADLYSYIQGKGGLTVINPGTPGIDETYMAACDIVMNYEGLASNYLAATFPAWTINYPSRRFWHCIHDVTDTTQRDSLLAKTLVNRAGHVYLTTESSVTGDANPYNSLPTDPFWTGMVAKVRVGDRSAWTDVTFQNGWTNYGFTNQTVQYRLLGDLVQIRGAMGGGTLNTPAFTLPVGFRPPAATTAILVTGSVNAEGVADLATTGTVTIFASSNALIRFPLSQFSVS